MVRDRKIVAKKTETQSIKKQDLISQILLDHISFRLSLIPQLFQVYGGDCWPCVLLPTAVNVQPKNARLVLDEQSIVSTKRLQFMV